MKAFRLLASANGRGVPTDEIVPQLGLSNSKGISGVIQGMRRYLKEKANGTPVDSLLWATGRPGNKKWHVDAHKLREAGILQ